jgi:Tfp pilus assembly protein PilO
MKDRIFALLSKAHPRMLWLGMAILAAFIAFEGWHLALRIPFAQWKELRAQRLALSTVMAATPREPAELARLSTEVQALTERLNSELRPAQTDEQLTTHLITELDHSASSSGAALKAVKPGAQKVLGGFEEVSYEVNAEGKYLMLSRWLMDLERVLGPSVAVAEFNMKATETRDAAVTLKLAVYRGAVQGPGGK